ncbi:aminomethyltransferase family protein [Roseovarius aestuarii]|nr:aminomethyltransferase family protein [Roseovarius aestuarii]
MAEVINMKSRSDARIIATQFTALLGQPPYRKDIMRSKSGLKRTAFFDTIGHAKEFHIHNTYLKPDVFTDPLEEYWTLRNDVGLFDVTGEEVVEITGPDALELINDVMPRDVAKMRDGMSFYSVLCHDFGGIVEDGILVRFNADKFWWVGGPGNSEEFLYANIRGRDVEITSHNDSLHVASVQGPKSRDVMNTVCADSLADLPVFGVLETDLCGVPVTITRTGYTAELGYDIYVDIERGPQMYKDLLVAVQAAGGSLCGSHCMGIRRVEAGILNFGFDFDWQHTPADIGLEWMISETKAPYRAQKALIAVKHNLPTRRLTGFRLEGSEVPLVGDKVYFDGQEVGVVTSATASPSLEVPLAMGYVETSITKGNDLVEIDCGGTRYSARVVPCTFLDPERKLMRA